jgi:guanyl-specific ribonuclease Sa
VHRPAAIGQATLQTTGLQLDADTTPMGVEAEMVAESLAANEPGFTLGNVYPFSLQPQLHREYVYGSGDGGVDEFLAYYDGTNRAEPYFVVQDAGGDVVAIVDDNGPTRNISFTLADGTGAVGDVSTARVAGQFTYDAYGTVLSADHLLPHPAFSAGHKGLFAERLDTPLAWQTGGTTVDESPRVVPFARVLYHNRNRIHNPRFGRFMQSDPNATGIVALDTLAYHGTAIGPIAVSPDLDAWLGDGANLHQYIGSNPWRGHDALGLTYTVGSVTVGTTIGASITATQASTIVSSSTIVGVGLGGGAIGSLSGASALVAFLLPGLIVSAPLVALYDSTITGPNAAALNGFPLSGNPLTVQAGNVRSVLAYITASGGNPPPEYRGGQVFKNRERRLPTSTTYREYDILPNTPGVNRGPHRLVIGADGSAWYTNDHYASFARIQ